MKFSQEIKYENMAVDKDPLTTKAYLAAFVLASCQGLSDKMMVCRFYSPRFAKEFVRSLKGLYDWPIDLTRKRSTKLTKILYTYVTIHGPIKNLLEDLGLEAEDQALKPQVKPWVLASDRAARQFIGGWFVNRGSMSDLVKTSYHLEFRFKDPYLCQLVQGLFDRFEIPIKKSQRRKELILYVKQSDVISDILRLMECHQSLMAFESARIHRDFHNSLRRLDNCEVANEMKTIRAGQGQVEAIKLLQESHRLDFLEERLQVVAHLRLSYPEASLRELSDLLLKEEGVSLSKSGIKHRLDKLVDLAQGLIDK